MTEPRREECRCERPAPVRPEELGEPHSVVDPAVVGKLVQKYGVGAEVAKQAHWRFDDLVSLMVQELPDGSMVLRFGFLESLPRDTQRSSPRAE